MIRLAILLTLLTALTAGAWTQEMLMGAAYTRRGAAPASSFSPESVAGITYWYDATSASTLQLSGTSVTGWSSRVGGYKMYKGSANSPTNFPNSLNGLNMVDFKSHRMTNAIQDSATGNVAYAWFFVIYTPSTLVANGSGAYFSSGRNGNGTRYAIGACASGSYEFGWAGVNSGVPLSSSTFDNSTSTPYVMSYLKSTSGWTIKADGLQVAGVIADASYPTTPSAWELGAEGTYFANCKIGDALMLHSNTNTNDYNKIEGYLAWKWGLQGSLPTNHPYKASAP